jgi:hypothetical protein
MACFLVPVGEAIITTVVQKVAEKREKEKEADTEKAVHTGIKWSRRLSWLNKMLWGGSLLLAIEHVWHGEVVPWPPFLTAMGNSADVAPMLHEMVTVGVAMAVAVTVIWGIMVIIAEVKARAVPAAKVTPIGGGIE